MRKVRAMPADDCLSVQLYSLRSIASLDDQLRLVRANGLSYVEATSSCYEDVKRFRTLLDRHGLAAPSGHVGIDVVRGGSGRAVDLCGETGIELLVLWGFPEAETPVTESGWARAGAELGGMAQALAEDGVRFAFHNHDWELQSFGAGRVALDVLFDAAGGTPLEWQPDLAWLARGKADVGALLERHRARITACHVKDMAALPTEEEEGWADLGYGVLPWDVWWPKMRSYGARWMVLEHDSPSDPARFLRRSVAAARGLGGKAT